MADQDELKAFRFFGGPANGKTKEIQATIQTVDITEAGVTYRYEKRKYQTNAGSPSVEFFMTGYVSAREIEDWIND